jgi:hypothetical protein
MTEKEVIRLFNDDGMIGPCSFGIARLGTSLYAVMQAIARRIFSPALSRLSCITLEDH